MTLTVQEDGQITLPSDAVRHFGVRPGQQVTLELKPDGEGAIRRAESTDPLDRVLGRWKTDKQLSIKEMNEIIARGWAGLLDDDDDD